MDRNANINPLRFRVQVQRTVIVQVDVEVPSSEFEHIEAAALLKAKREFGEAEEQDVIEWERLL